MGMRGGLPHQGDLCLGQGPGLVDEVAEGALQGQGFGSEGVGGDDGVGVFVMQDMNASGEEEPIYGLTPCTGQKSLELQSDVSGL